MQVKQRQKSADGPRSGEKQRRSEEEEKRASSGFSPDAKLCVSLLCLSVSLFIAWLHVQQSATLAEITQRYERERGSVRALEEQISAVSLKLQASSSSALKHAVSSTLDSWAAQRAEQEASELLLRGLEERVRGVTEARRGGELEELKRRSRAAHGSVTQQLNQAEALLRELSQRLQEVQDGTGRNGRALERSEEEDAQRLRDHLHWSERGVSWVLQQLQHLDEQGLELHRRLDTRAPHDTRLPAAEDAVRSMLRLRAQLGTTYSRLEELLRQVQSAEEQMKKSQTAAELNVEVAVIKT